VLPDETRALFYANHGRWALEVVDAGSQRVAAAKALATATGMSGPVALRRLQQSTTLREGTHVEIEWLQRRLRPFIAMRAVERE
jgi:hypothetical protein